MKFLLVICFIIFFLNCVFSVSKFWGIKQPGHTLVASKLVDRRAVNFTIQVDSLDYTSPGFQWLVTYISIIDQDPTGGADCGISSGGIGQRYAHLYFRSKFSGGIKMYAEIYARKR